MENTKPDFYDTPLATQMVADFAFARPPHRQHIIDQAITDEVIWHLERLLFHYGQMHTDGCRRERLFKLINHFKRNI